jgi:branched-chain amino acid transport system permease protein
MGNSGVMNFGSVAFMAIGAYASALTTMTPAAKRTFLPDLPGWLSATHWPALSGPFVGGGVAGAVALLIGWPIMRLSGISAAIATLSFLIIVYIVLGNWNSLTGGQQSLMGLPNFVGLWTAACWAVGAVLVAFVYQETRFAIALRASREDEVAARASGVEVERQRLIAFVASSAIAGAAGALYGHFLGTLRIDNFYLDMTFQFLSMLVVGGARSLTGAVFGTIAICVLTEMLRWLEVGVNLPGLGWRVSTAPGLGDVVLAALMLAIIIFRPQGLAGGREIADFIPNPRRG